MKESPEVKQLADEYDRSLEAGQSFIAQRWAYLLPPTQDWLTATGFYDRYGGRRAEAPHPDPHRIEDLEHYLGVLRAAAQAEIPHRDTPQGTKIPKEACGEEVMRAIETMLFEPRARDPMFLRLALHSLRQYELANLLMRLPTKPTLSAGRIAKVLTGSIVAGVLSLIAPAVLAYSLAAVAKDDVFIASVGFYILAFTALAVWSIKQQEKESADERAWLAWQRFGFANIDGSWTACGAGATELLRNLLRQGGKVPPLAFDLCAALTAATLQQHGSQEARG